MPYTPIVNPADLKTQMYPEVQAIITRSDASIATEAIDSAIAQVKMYLTKYDTKALFGDPVADTAATVTDKYLCTLVKTIATWYLLRLANPVTDLSIARTWFEDAIATLKNIQRGTANPEGWPYKDTTGETAPQGDSIYATSTPQRRNHY